MSNDVVLAVDIIGGGGVCCPFFLFVAVALVGETCSFLCRIDVGAFAFAPAPFPVLACLGEVDKRNCGVVAEVVAGAVVVAMGLALF